MQRNQGCTVALAALGIMAAIVIFACTAKRVPVVKASPAAPTVGGQVADIEPVGRGDLRVRIAGSKDWWTCDGTLKIDGRFADAADVLRWYRAHPARCHVTIKPARFAYGSARVAEFTTE
jgi:hypothetical protein